MIVAAPPPKNENECREAAPSGAKPGTARQVAINSAPSTLCPPSELLRPGNTAGPAKRIMAVGPTGAGKSSLLHALGLSEAPATKTEHVRITPRSIDTPGEMLDIPSLYHALITSSVKADLVLFLADPTRKCSFPIRIARALRAPVVGVVTKADLAGPEDMARARQALKRAGVGQIVETSIVDGSGFKELGELIS